MYKKLQTFSKLRVIPPHALTKEATVNAYSSIAACESCVLVRSTFWCPTETSGFTIQRSISMLAKPAQRRFPREILRSSVLGALLLSCLYSDLTMSLDARPDFFCAMVEVVIQTTFGPEYARRVRVDCARWLHVHARHTQQTHRALYRSSHQSLFPQDRLLLARP